MTVSYHTAPQLRDCFRFRRSIALQAIKSYITVGDARFKVRSRITSIRRSRIVRTTYRKLRDTKVQGKAARSTGNYRAGKS